MEPDNKSDINTSLHLKIPLNSQQLLETNEINTKLKYSNISNFIDNSYLDTDASVSTNNDSILNSSSENLVVNNLNNSISLEDLNLNDQEPLYSNLTASTENSIDNKEKNPRSNVKSDNIELSSLLQIKYTNVETNETRIREISIYKINNNPKILALPDFLNDEECDHLVGLSEGKWERSKTSIGQSYEDKKNYLSGESISRTSFSSFLKTSQTPIVESIQRRISGLTKLPELHIEPFVLIRYEQGQYFKCHHDGDFRKSTVLIYLNDVEGGETDFPYLGFKIKPLKGMAVYWDNIDDNEEVIEEVYHAGLPPTFGVKYAVNCFVGKTPLY